MGEINPGFAGCGDTTGVVNEESDQKRAIPLVERKQRRINPRLGAEIRGTRRRGAGEYLFGNSREDLQIILRDAAIGCGRLSGVIRIGRRLAATCNPVTATMGWPASGHPFREWSKLRQEKRESEQRNRYVSGNFHYGRHFYLSQCEPNP